MCRERNVTSLYWQLSSRLCISSHLVPACCIPQQLVKGYRKLKKGGQRAIHTPLWFESTVQLANRNQASVNWANMFDYLDPGGKNVTLDAQKFHDWSVVGRADANFKYAVAQLPTATGFAHVVSIVKSKDSDDLTRPRVSKQYYGINECEL